MINTANYYRPSEASTLGADGEMVEISLVLSPTETIDRVEVHVFGSDYVLHDPAHDWNITNTTVVSRRIYPQGIPTGANAFAPADWPLRGEGITQLRFAHRGPVPTAPFGYWWLKFLDPDGKLVGEARFDTLPPPGG